MAAMTPERREVRKSYKAIDARKAEILALIRPLNMQLNEQQAAAWKLQKDTCKHPAMKYGSACGMGWCDCPDCGYSNP